MYSIIRKKVENLPKRSKMSHNPKKTEVHLFLSKPLDNFSVPKSKIDSEFWQKFLARSNKIF